MICANTSHVAICDTPYLQNMLCACIYNFWCAQRSYHKTRQNSPNYRRDPTLFLRSKVFPASDQHISSMNANLSPMTMLYENALPSNIAYHTDQTLILPHCSQAMSGNSIGWPGHLKGEEQEYPAECNDEECTVLFNANIPARRPTCHHSKK